VRMAAVQGDVRIDGNFSIEPGPIDRQVLAASSWSAASFRATSNPPRGSMCRRGIIVGDVKAGSITVGPARACAGM